MILPRPAAAASYYWDGSAATNDLWNFSTAPTNWSTSSVNIVNTSNALPGGADSVFFFAFPYGSGATTELGANTSITSLTFLSGLPGSPAATVDGGGTFSLTLGAGGLTDQQGTGVITISANTVLGASQIWANVSSNPVNISGVVSGASTSNIVYAGSGAFNLSNANTYSGSTIVGGFGNALTGTGPTSLTLSGNGSIQNTSLLTVNGGAALTLDDTGTNSADRIADSLGISSNGGTIGLLGNTSAATSETVGTLTVGSGATQVNVTPGSGQTATLTFGSGANSIPSFSRTAAGGTVNFSATGTIAAPFVSTNNGVIGAWATIGSETSGTAPLDWATLSGINIAPYSGYTTGGIGTWNSSSNVKLNNSQTIAGALQINSIYLTGSADVIGSGTAGAANTITLSNGGIIADSGSGSYTVNGNRSVTGATELGGNGFSAGSSNNEATAITVAAGIPDIIINVPGATTSATDTNALQISAIFVNGPSGHTGVTKTGGGLLDLSDGNNAILASTNTGAFTIDGGTVLINNDLNLGAAPTSFTAGAIVLNGGEIDSTQAFSFNANRGITVGAQGGTFSYVGAGATLSFTSKVAGTGGFAFSANPVSGSATLDLDTVASGNTYEGPTTLFAKSGSSITWLLANQIPSNSAVTVTGTGTLNMGSVATENFGSLSSATGVGTITNLAMTFTLGGNGLSTTYGGTIAGGGALNKVGGGTQTFADSGVTALTYTGATNITTGALLIGSGTTMSGTSLVTVKTGATLGGSGTISAPVTVSGGGRLSPNNSAGGTSTLTINGNLTLTTSGITGDAALDFDLGATNGGTSSFSPSDVVKLTGSGNLTLGNGSSPLIINLTPLAGFGAGVYDLLDASGSTGTATIPSAGKFTIDASNTNFTYTALPPGTSQGSYTNPATSKELVLLVTSIANPQVIWTGNAGSSGNATWDATSANWTPGTYANGDGVTFNSNGVNTNINLGGSSFTPSSVTFNGSSAVPYTLSNGTIAGGPIQIKSGTFVANLTIGSASSVTVGGATASGASGTPTLAGNGTINGPLTVGGTGAGLVAGILAPSRFTGSSGTTLNLGGALTINTGAILDYNLSSSTASGNDKIGITGSGAVNYGTGGVLNINDYSGSLGLGNYTLINDAGSTTPSGGTGWTVGTNNDPNSATRTYTIGLFGKNLTLDVGQALTWGGQNSSAWDTTTTNWFLGANGATYADNYGSAVNFGDTQFASGPGVFNSAVTMSVSGGVTPASVTFSNSGVGYTITSNDSTNLGITGATGLTLNGTAGVTLAGINTYTGATTLNAGSLLIIGNNDSIGSTSGTIAPLVFNGGTLRYGLGLSSNATTSDVSGRPVNINSAGATIDVDGNAVTYANGIGNGGSGGLTVIDSSGSGLLTLNGVSTYTGTTAVNSGTLVVGPSGAIPATALSIGTAGTATFTNHTQTVTSISGTGNLNLNGSSGTTLTVSSVSGIFSGSIAGPSGSLSVSSPASLTLTNPSSSYGGGTTINGSLTINGTTTTAGTYLGSGIVNVTSTGSLNVSGLSPGLTGTYYNSGNGVLNVNQYYNSLATLQGHLATLPVLATDNTYTTNGKGGGAGGTNPNFNYNVGGEGNQFPTVLANQFTYQYYEGYYSGYIYIATAGQYSFGTDSDDGSMVFIDGNVVVSNNAYQGWNGDTGPQQSGTATLTAGFHNIVVGFYQGGGGYGLNVYETPGATAPTGSQELSNSILYSAGASTASIGGLTGSGTVNLGILSTLQIGINNTSSSFAGSFTGGNTTSIAVTGGGTLTLTGSSLSTFVSPITISNGTLRVNSASATGGAAVFVGDGTGANPATLSGTGTIAGAVTVNGPGAGTNGGTIVGTSGASLTLTGGLTLGAGSNSSFTLGTPNTTAGPALIVTSGGSSSGSLVSTGANTISFTTPQVGTYDLFSYTGASPNFGNFSLSNSLPLNFSYALINNTAQSQIDLQVFGASIFWTGATSAWKVPDNTSNWVSGSGTVTPYTDGSAVTFADTYPAGNTPVPTVNGNAQVVIQAGGVLPSNVNFNNSLVNYVLSDADNSNGIGGSALINKSGTATVTFMSPNNLTGQVTITGGQLNLQNGGALGASTGVIVGPGAALQLQGGISVGAIPLTISGSGLAASPAGALQSVSGANTYAGLVSVAGGSATITSSSTTSGDGLTLTGGINPAGGAVTFNGPGSTTVSTAGISGTGGSVTVGNGAFLTLSAANSFTGLTTINDTSILSVPSSGSLQGSLTYNSTAASTIAGTLGGTTSVLTVTNGTLLLNGENTYGGGTSLSAGTIQAGVNPTVTGVSPHETLTGSALGLGTATLTGGTLQDNGTAITLANSFALSGTVNFASAGSGTLTLDGTGLSVPATVTLPSDAVLNVTNTSTTINDTITGAGGLSKTGLGTLFLGGANTFSGGTTINPSSANGIIQVNNPLALQNSVVTINDTSGIVFNSGIGHVSLGGLSGTPNFTVQDSSGNPNLLALTLGNSAGNGKAASYSGNLTAVSLSKTGGNLQVLSGTNAFNTITVSAGTLQTGQALPGNTPLGTAPITLSGGTLALTGVYSSTPSPGLQMQFYQDSALPLSANFTSLSTMVSHFNTLTPAFIAPSTAGSTTFLQFPGSGPGGTTVSAPGNTGPANGLAFTSQGFNGSTNYEVQLSGSITITTGGNYTFSTESDDGSVLFLNGADTPLVNNNAFQGNTIATSAPVALNAGTYPIEIGYYQGAGNAGLNVDYSGPDTGGTDMTPLFLNIANSVLSSSTTLLGTQAYSNNVTVSSSSTIDVVGSPNATMGTLSINGATLTVNGTGTYGLTMGATTLTGSPTFDIVGSGGTLTLGALNDNGVGRTITLTGNGAFTLGTPATSLVQGTVFNVSSGTLNSNVTGAIGSLATINLGATGSFNVGATQTISALNSMIVNNGTVTLANGTALTIGNTNGLSSNFSGTIAGNGALIKAGAGTLALGGINSYQNGTTINAGTVVINNSSAFGPNAVTLAGGTLRFGAPPANTNIGVHFGTDENAGVYVLAPTSSAGVPGFTMTNWNNTAGQSGGPTALLNSIGVANGASVTWTSGGTYSDITGGAASPVTPDNQLMGSFLNDGAATGMGNQVTISGIPYASYSVVAYVGSEGGANGRSSLLTVTASGGGTAQYSWSTDVFPNTNPYTYVQITNTTSGTYPLGNYAVTTGLAGSTVTVSDGSYPNGANTGLEAVEIIDTVPPATSETIANSILVTQNSTMDLTGTSTDTTGPVSINGSTLSVTGGSTGANVPFALTLGTVSLTGNPTFNVANNGSGTGTLILGPLADGGMPRTITLSGPGAVTLASPASSLVVGTIVNANNGSLNLNAAGALGTTATVNVAAPATLALGANQTLSALNGAGAVNLNANTLTVGSTDNLSSSFGGAISGGGTLRVAGTGTFALTSAASVGNTAIGVNAGSTLAVEPASAGTIAAGTTGAGSAGATLNLGSGTLDMTGAPTIGTFALQQQGGYSGTALSFNGATLKFNIGSTGASELVDNGPASAVAFAGGTNTIVLTPVAGTNSLAGGNYPLIQLPAGSNGLLGTFEFPGGATTEIVGVGSSFYTLSLSNTSTEESLNVRLSINSTWTQTASGSYNWSNPNTNWTGGNVPQTAGDSATFGQATSNGPQTIAIDLPTITVGSLTFNNSGTSVYTIGPSGSDTLVFDGGGAGATAKLINATNNNIISAPVLLNSKVAADVATGTTLTLSGALSGNTALNLNPDSPNAGTLVLSGNNASLSAAVNLSAGKLNFASGSLGGGPITFVGNSTLQYANGANSQDISNRLQAIPANVVATIDTNNNNVSFNTGLTGAGGLTKIGAGILTLNGTNTYQGPTLISGGALQVNQLNTGLTATSSVSVGGNGTLGGSGTIISSVSTASGGQISPSLGLGTPSMLNITGNLTLANGTVLSYLLNNPGFLGSDDQMAVTGNLSLQGTATVNILGTPLQGTYPLIIYTGSATGSVSGWTVPGSPTDTFTLRNGLLSLTVAGGSGPTVWISNGGDSFGASGNWSNGVPSAGQAATIGTGGTSPVIDSAYSVGVLNLTGTNGGYFIASSGAGTGFSLTLDNLGAGAQVNVAANSAQSLFTSLILADSSKTTTFSIDSSSSLYITSFNGTDPAISGSGQGIVLTGGGLLELASPNSYTGPTKINAGTLQIDAGANIASTSITVGAGATLQLAGSAGLPSTANITTHGTGGSGDGAISLSGGATQTVGIISGDSTTNVNDGTVTYAGNTTVGDGTASRLTAAQILQNTLTINANSTVTISPSGPGMTATASTGSSSTAAVASSDASTADGSDSSGSDSSGDALAAIQSAIASGSITSARGQQLENRIAAIERLATTDPGLDVSLLENHILASLPSSSVWSASGSSLSGSDSSLLAVDSSTFAPASGTAAFASSAGSAGSPATVPEPSTLLLAALGGIGLALAARRRRTR